MSLSLLLTRLMLLLHPLPGSRRRGDRGDVPGWVMVTILTIGMAIAIFAVARPQLINLLKSALNQAK